MYLVDEKGFEYVEVDNDTDTYVATGKAYNVPMCAFCVHDGTDRCDSCDAQTIQDGIGKLYFQPKEKPAQ